ncbi:hypothetical protein Y032_0013g2139 [Ancylostoma ceylanicum]|uniref:Uncharacterized protein n=1 Tax=Ancylostoma ceylanicum TaxID=53326 RepID=A0A016VBN4_9BILA|nr:hypothetical protein Y032_0013g2139 [Ancylostoma ceylanicum]
MKRRVDMMTWTARKRGCLDRLGGLVVSDRRYVLSWSPRSQRLRLQTAEMAPRRRRATPPRSCCVAPASILPDGAGRLFIDRFLLSDHTFGFFVHFS